MADRGDWGQLGSILYYMHYTCLGDIRFPFVYFHFSFTTTFPGTLSTLEKNAQRHQRRKMITRNAC